MSRAPRQIDPNQSARHRFGWTLRRLRSQAGYSLQGFARRLGKSDSYLSAVELAQVRCTRTFAVACDELVNAGNQLLELWAAADSEWNRIARERGHRDGGGGEAQCRVLTPPLERTRGSAITRAPSRPLIAAALDRSSRDAVTAGLEADLAAMQAFRAADRQVGGGHLYATVIAYLHERVGPRLFGDGAHEDGPFVFCAAAALTEMAGWMAHDAGLDNRAERHFDRALNLATAGRDHQLCAHILGSMSHLAHQLGKPRDAVRFAGDGRSRLQRRPHDPRLLARLDTMEAKALVALREPAACAERLARAEQALHATASSEPSVWAGPFDEASLASDAARCMRQLGRMAEARRHAERVVALRVGNRTRSRAFGQLILIGVLVRQGELDEACALGHEVVDSTQALGSFRVLQQLQGLRRLLEPHRSAEMVAAFLACLTESVRGRMWLYHASAGDRHGPPADPSRKPELDGESSD